ncbi:hypothetical protein BY996DRAFT_3028953 [Phakopsora pachyrhizi]|uniref:Expressed protein n=1 Tax=Phakopsora pachyrhizi TaxID=170000 RepID=A0AAV0AIG8_PHAPC|nr:hypothetical protein BY996DRAFT_3028953 [Phakopsora pachyrhizi]CAH7668206.1 expressed protein [Phakopsora pachyrhizi]
MQTIKFLSFYPFVDKISAGTQEPNDSASQAKYSAGCGIFSYMPPPLNIIFLKKKRAQVTYQVWSHEAETVKLAKIWEYYVATMMMKECFKHQENPWINVHILLMYFCTVYTAVAYVFYFFKILIIANNVTTQLKGGYFTFRTVISLCCKPSQ